MAYNNGFPMSYQQMYPQYNFAQQNQIQQPVTQQSNGIIWVQGEAGAKSYLVAPNTTIQLWDSEDQIIYLKSADASGMPSMKILDYTIRGSDSSKNEFSIDNKEFIHKDEFNALKLKIEQLEDEISELRSRKENTHGKSVVQLDAE